MCFFVLIGLRGGRSCSRLGHWHYEWLHPSWVRIRRVFCCYARSLVVCIFDGIVYMLLKQIPFGGNLIDEIVRCYGLRVNQ